MRSVKVKAIKVNALNYTFLKGLLLHSKTSPFALQNESFCKPKGVLLKNHCFPIGFNFRCRLCRAMHN